MKLVVDTHHLSLENAGTKRITVNLLPEFRRMPGVEVVELQPSYSLKKGKTTISKLKGHLLRFFWVHIHLPIKCAIIKADILLSPEFNTPMFTPCPRAVIAPDAHMRAQREYTSALWFYFYYIPFIELAIRRSDIIFTISQFAKEQVVQLMKLDSEKVVVAYIGVEELFFKKISKETGLPIPLEPQQYILFIGTFEARKNIEKLIDAFGMLKRRHLEKTARLKLAIVGQPASGKYSDRSQQIGSLIKSLGLQGEIIVTGYVPDEVLPQIYQQAAFLVFPSLQEGFGLPIIEGFASQIPVITSNVCSMPEIAGDAALLFTPTDVEELAEKMEALYFDNELRERLVGLGNKQVMKFTWQKTAEIIHSALQPHL